MGGGAGLLRQRVVAQRTRTQQQSEQQPQAATTKWQLHATGKWRARLPRRPTTDAGFLNKTFPSRNHRSERIRGFTYQTAPPNLRGPRGKPQQELGYQKASVSQSRRHSGRGEAATRFEALETRFAIPKTRRRQPEPSDIIRAALHKRVLLLGLGSFPSVWKFRERASREMLRFDGRHLLPANVLLIFFSKQIK